MASSASTLSIAGTTCPRCTDEATKTCGGCKNIRYCSIECQQADWPTHKVLCSTFKDFSDDKRPSPAMRRIVVFLPDEKKPRFMWAPAQRHFAGAAGFYQDISTSSVLADTKQLGGASHVYNNIWTGNVYTATADLCELSWRGPIFAYCGRLHGGDYEELEVTSVHDMDMRTYADLVAFLIDYHNDTKEHALRKGPKVMGVKVSCDGDRRFGAPQFQDVRVPRSHPIFYGNGSLSMISKSVQMPLTTWKYPDAQAPWRKDYEVGDVCNQHITFMHLSCDPNAEFDTLKNIGAFERLNPHRQNVLNEITPDRWSEYMSQWKAEKADATAAEASGKRAYTLAKAKTGLERMDYRRTTTAASRAPCSGATRLLCATWKPSSLLRRRRNRVMPYGTGRQRRADPDDGPHRIGFAYSVRSMSCV
ncbi:hypothetical protein Q7P37_000069 [Cladosporium fusiforme]